MKKITLISILMLLCIVAITAWVACGSNSGSTGAVNLSMSDPPTCGTASSGPFLHAYVTVKDVQISTNPNAGSNDSSWVDLTPNMAPKQVDLLGSPSSGCFLANFGTTSLPPGNYQQIRLVLTDTLAANNACGSGSANCVVLSATPNTPQPLQLSSEMQTGIKIPSGQIAGGQFTIAAGESKNLNIDFDACASVVLQGNGQFRLKPVLHAGEVQLTSNITGRLVDQNGSAITTGIVALEQRDASGVDRVILQTTPDANGNFILCPVADGSYDLVAVGTTTSNGTQTAYGPALVAGISPGATLGNITLTNNGAPANVNATIATSPSSTAVDIVVSALQSVTIGNNATPTPVTIPLALQQSATETVTVTGSLALSPLAVPAANVTVGTLSNGAVVFTPAPGGAVDYTIDAMAFSTTTNLANCSQPDMTSNTVAVTPGSTAAVSTLSFTGCQ